MSEILGNISDTLPCAVFGDFRPNTDSLSSHPENNMLLGSLESAGLTRLTRASFNFLQ